MAGIPDVLEARDSIRVLRGSAGSAGSVDKLKKISPGSGQDFLLCTSLRHPEMCVAGGFVFYLGRLVLLREWRPGCYGFGSGEGSWTSFEVRTKVPQCVRNPLQCGTKKCRA